MQLEYFKHPIGNFGDDLNAWIWDALLPGWQEWDDRVTLIEVGTLLNKTVLAFCRDRRILVLRSGPGYVSDPPRLPLPERSRHPGTQETDLSSGSEGNDP